MGDTTSQQPSHPILGFARALDSALDRVGSFDPIFLTADEKRAAVTEIVKARRRLDALYFKALHAADLDEVGSVNGCTSTGAWLGHETLADETDARAEVRLANDLAKHCPATSQVLAAGAISVDHAKVITWALKRLPDDLEPELFTQAEKLLADEAQHLTPARLRKAGKHLLEVIAPDLADKLLKDQLQRDEARAFSRARLTMRGNGDGTTEGWFRVPDLQAGMLKAALDAITAPRKIGDGRFDPTTGKKVDYPNLMGQAFCELIEHLPTDRLPDHGRTAATVVVTLSLESLRTGLGAAGLNDHQTISAGEARRLACNAGLIPAVLGKTSTTLDLGREARFFSKAQRTAMALRDGGCRAETCDRPPSWTEAHHDGAPWAQGGRTDLKDGVLLCGHHHRLAHHPDYDHKRMPNGDLRFHRRT